MGEAHVVEETDPEEAFAALSDDTRIAILQALWEAEEFAASFSELREAVGMRDSGQFNYHLDELVGRFVARTGDGYELTQAGMQVNGAIEAGAYTAAGSIDPVALETPCPTCGGERTLYYEDETVEVECDSCPVSYRFGAPPAVFAGYDREAVPAVASRYLRTTIRHLDAGFCPFCDGRVRPTVRRVDDVGPIEDAAAEFDEDVVESVRTLPIAEYACQQCGATPTAGLNLALVDHPAVAGFYYRRGIDVGDRSVWEIPHLTPDHQDVRSRDPFRACVTYEADGDTLTLVVDGTLDVLDVET